MDQAAPQNIPNLAERSDDPLRNGTYIRTFAKDVAKLTGKPDTGGIPTIPKKELDLPKPVVATVAPEAKKPADFLPPTALTAAVAEIQTEAPAPAPKQPSSFDAARAQILSRLATKAPKEEPRFHTMPQEAIAPVSKAPDTPSPLHTFKTDFEDKTRKTGSSKLSVLAAEGDAPRQATPKLKRTNGQNPVIIGAGAVIVLAGVAGLFFAVQFATTKPKMPIIADVPSLVFADKTKSFSGTGAELMQELRAASDALVGSSLLVVAYPDNGGVPDAPSLPSSALIEALSMPAPDLLLRSISAESTLGILDAGAEAYPFFVLKVDSYERSFAGMLAWEPELANDLKALYPPYTPGLPTTAPATTTSPVSSGTSAIIPPPSAPAGFMDVVVANHDARVLFDAYHRAILMYGYRDRSTLIIARNQKAFIELLSRLDAAR